MDQCWQNQAREGGREGGRERERERNREGYGGEEWGRKGGREAILKLKGRGRQRNNRIQRMTIKN